MLIALATEAETRETGQPLVHQGNVGHRNNDILSQSVLTAAALDTQSPVYKPVLSFSQLQAGPIPKGDFWDDSATYPGALNPSGSANWVSGWTDFQATEVGMLRRPSHDP